MTTAEEKVDYGVEPEVLWQFVDESEELLDNAVNLFIELENNPSDGDLIDKVFRVVHTIKGNSAFFNLFKVKNLAHSLEDLMNDIRQGFLGVTGNIISILIESTDKLKAMLERVRESLPELSVGEDLETLIAEVKKARNKTEANTEIWEKVFKILKHLRNLSAAGDPAQALVGELEGQLLKLYTPPAQASPAEPALRSLVGYLMEGFKQQVDKREILDLLQVIRDNAPENKKEDLSEALDVFTATYETNGFTLFLRDFILEKLSGLNFGTDDTDHSASEALLTKLRTILNEPFQGQLAIEKSVEIYENLQELVAHEDNEAKAEIESALDVYESVIDVTGFTYFMKDFILDKLNSLKSDKQKEEQQKRAEQLLLSLQKELESEGLTPDSRVGFLTKLHELAQITEGNSLKTVQEVIDFSEKNIDTSGFTPEIKEFIMEKLFPHQASVQEKKQESEKADEAKTAKTMRVSENSIDSFLDFVGELVVVGEMFTHVQRRLQTEIGNSLGVNDLKKSVEMFLKLSEDLQLSILQVRKVTMKSLLQRAPKLVRDVAGERGKKIKVFLSGEDVLIDKSLLETLDGPFTHLVRNAADHGIEMPEQRLQSGKSEEGNIYISAAETDNDIILSIREDGAGINKDKIKKKAIENHLRSEEELERMSEEDVIGLICMPGFSTAETVSEISGRGVGLDVVRRNVEKANGRLSIESVLGQGTTFTVQLPKTVTVKIIRGLVVRLGSDNYIIPIDIVGESFKVEPQMLNTVSGRGECVLRHDKVVPVLRLSDILHRPTSNSSQIGVTINKTNKNFILMVDEVLGAQKVVIKDIHGYEQYLDLFIGGAILGNEQVALVLNAENL